jgi:hypothetical protein
VLVPRLQAESDRASDRLKAGLQRSPAPACAAIPATVTAGVGSPAPHAAGRRFVTFVNPAPEKGAYVFVAIAHELGRRRPEIPSLVVESRGDRGNLAALGLGRDQPVNVHLMANTTDPRRFWAVSKLVMLPSVCWENQPLVAIEAMINGIPVVGADRGGIPEVLGDSGFLLPLPEYLTPSSQVLPAPEEVEPWVETIIRLWDDQALYEERSLKAREGARRWHPDQLRPLYAEFFGNVRVQARPPLVLGAGHPTPCGDGLGDHRTDRTLGPLESRLQAVASARGFRLKAGLQHDPPPLPLIDGESVADPAEVIPLSFVVCVTDEAILAANLLASPCLAPEAPHELISVLKAPSAAAGLHAGLERARNDWVVLVHQDVVLPPGWDHRILSQLRQAERTFGPIGVAGVYGVSDVREAPGQPLAAERIGQVVDRGRLLQEGPELPARAATLDELLLIVRRDTPLRADPALGFHLYGADLCLQARERGLNVVVLDALCQHNSRSLALPESFFVGAEVFARKWAGRLPIATPCVVFDRAGWMYLLGNAPQDGPSIAAAEGRPLLQAQGFVPTPRRGAPVVRLS